MSTAIQEMTARRRAELGAAVREARLNEAQRIAQIGNWEWDIQNDGDWWSDELYRMLQVDPNTEQPCVDVFLELVHPQDRQRLREATRRVLANGGPHAIDVRVVLRDGTEKIMHSQGEVEFDDDGRPLRMRGTLQDVTERKAIEAALRLSETRYKEAQRLAKIGNWEWNLAADASWWSDELYRILEEDPAAYAASFENFIAKVHPDDRPMLIEGKEQFPLCSVDGEPVEVRLVFAGGREKKVEMRIEVRTGDGGRPAAVVGTVRDVTERWELERRLRESEARYSSTVELAVIGIAHIDTGGRFVWANPQLCDMLGYTFEELRELTIVDVSHPDDAYVTAEGRAQLHAGEIGSLSAEKRYVRKDGRVIWVRIACTLKRDADGAPLYDISVVEDISDRKAAEARVQYLASHDEMTGLPNRTTFIEMLERAIAAAARANRKCAVLFIDLDRFKVINDSLGHEAGDQLLKEMANRLRRCMRESDVVARLGGDEFVVLLAEIRDLSESAAMARRILSVVLEPIRIMEHECRVTASIGIAAYPDNASDAATLMKHADVAMYTAKEDGKNNFQFHSAERSPMSVERLNVETRLGRALERSEFTVQYQPRIDVATGRIKGAEALLRWWSHELGAVPPARFIPVAEDTGLIVPIGKWILKAACRQNVAWQRAGLPPIVMSVNLSPRQFKNPALLDDIAEALEEAGMASRSLELELTESMIIQNVDEAAERLAAIAELGVRIAIDDFGTGYSSLSLLKRFPINTLKIDRSFVRDVPGNPEDGAITEAIISLGRILGVTVVAEGVESETQLAFLRERSCDEMQGFYFSRPCHPDAFAALLAGDGAAARAAPLIAS